ncbi:MAG: ABC transporter permease [Elusimicrobia bacterium]|nr:ABC transporter permease [Elusimicrobiota bacterium]
MTDSAPRWSWAGRMAWRDARGNRRKLALYVLAIAVGIAVLVAVDGFRENLERAIRRQGKALLGADLSIRSRDPFSDEANKWIDGLPGEKSREVAFNSMAQFPGSAAPRLVQIRAIEPGFPFYGAFQTAPPNVADFRVSGRCLVDQSLAVQYAAGAGSTVRIGSADLAVAAAVTKAPGEAAASSIFAPRIYVPFAFAGTSGLIRPGSLASYAVYVRLPPGVDAEALAASAAPFTERNHLHVETVDRRLRELGEISTNLTRFFALVGFSILLLGGTSVANAVSLYLSGRLATIAFLQCVGATRRDAARIYWIQIGAALVGGSIFGAAAGAALQPVLKSIVREFLPVDVAFTPAWGSVAEGLIVGVASGFLFAWIPLLRIRDVSPLDVLRVSERPRSRRRLFLPLTVLAAFIAVFAWWKTGEARVAMGFTAGTIAILLALAASAAGALRLARRLNRGALPYEWRQGLGNLGRPENQTVMLVSALGLIGCFLVSIFFLKSTLVDQITLNTGPSQPDLAFFDVQPAQVKPLMARLASEGAPALDRAPIVSMRIAAINGIPIDHLPKEQIPHWALRREYKSTYRDRLVDSEKSLAGVWPPKTRAANGPVPISLERSIAETLGVRLGSRLTFNVQGVEIETVVAHLREVDWYRVQPNFFAVFPSGVLEDAPSYDVITTKTGSPDKSGRIQREIIREFPTVSAIDLTLILSTLDQYLGRVARVLRASAGFGALAGAFLLVGSVLTSRQQRMRESALLRTIGASAAQLRRIWLAEGGFLGALSGAAGVTLGWATSWALAHFLFHLKLVSDAPAAVGIAVSEVLIGLLASWAGSRGILTRSPLDVLRAES